MGQMRQHNLVKFLLAGTLLTSFFFIETGGEGKATVLTDQTQNTALAKLYARPSLLASSAPITAIQVSEFTVGAPAKPTHRFADRVKKPVGLEAIADKKKLGLTLFFLGMVADKN